jgi:hypothetical protein
MPRCVRGLTVTPSSCSYSHPYARCRSATNCSDCVCMRGRMCACIARRGGRSTSARATGALYASNCMSDSCTRVSVAYDGVLPLAASASTCSRHCIAYTADCKAISILRCYTQYACPMHALCQPQLTIHSVGHWSTVASCH